MLPLANNQKFNVLLVEDNIYDAELTSDVFKRNSMEDNLIHFDDAQAAYDYLMNTTDLPKVILVDLNLIGMSGMEFIRLLKNNPKTKDIPIAVLTDSKDERHIVQTHLLNTAFLKKPVDNYKLFKIAHLAGVV